ncbi:MAG TPA: hypothetical protein VLZ83_06855 [Edaphocola sp.]|nr:hypothetical protein [Edaphocola sp.]
MFKLKLGMIMLTGALAFSVGSADAQKTIKKKPAVKKVVAPNKAFQYDAEAFADLQILRYEVPGWDQLTAKQKEFIYYLSQASLFGRDINWDQRGKYNLTVRKVIEAVYGTYKGNRESKDWQSFQTYAGQIWFSSGMYHHYSNDKIMPEFSEAYFRDLLKNSDMELLPIDKGEDIDGLFTHLKPIIFDKSFMPKMVDLREGVDNVANSSNNYYEGVTQEEVDEYYDQFPKSDHEPEWGLNSKLVKVNGEVFERIWKSGGMYGTAIDKMIYWIEKAIPLSENDQQKHSLELLVEYYKTGDLHRWDDYAIAWATNTNTVVDFTNGFIEVYGDAIGKKGSYESIVSIKDFESSKRIEAIAKQAQWFEDNSPLMPQHKKKSVKGINAKVINVVMESGDAAPSTPIGINLPNSDWIRKEHGSKSVSLGNIVHAYNESSGSGMLDEFAVNEEVKARAKKYGSLASDLHTDMHECIGHASGQINPGVGTPDQTLKNYASTLEEARADLVGLYYALDSKLVEIGVMPSLEVGKAEYDSYMMNGLMTQLVRIKAGDNIEESHMRNRALVAYWAYEKGRKDNVVEMIKRNGKTYVQVNDYNKLRVLFGDLLKEIQRIKSEGDFNAGKSLVETYGVKVNPELHKEVLERYATLNIKPYKGFIQPKLMPVKKDGKIVDVKIEFPKSFYQQMMEYGKEYGVLPIIN